MGSELKTLIRKLSRQGEAALVDDEAEKVSLADPDSPPQEPSRGWGDKR